MIFNYEVDDAIVTACETQVEDLQEALTQEVEARIKILLQKAREEAMVKTAGEIDIPALVQAAGMKSKSFVEAK